MIALYYPYKHDMKCRFLVLVRVMLPEASRLGRQGPSKQRPIDLTPEMRQGGAFCFITVVYQVMHLIIKVFFGQLTLACI